MPHFIVQTNSVEGNFIAKHGKDVTDPNHGDYSLSAHNFVQRQANRQNISFIEVADDLGEPCTLFPNTITPEGQPSKPEVRV
ncbi:hypothetical protein HZB96_02325 [Candidatus Gottesmanbacteria bacterium]|nr:hypothetical protein [Candidatus Gottesmanbacteria bacterium]